MDRRRFLQTTALATSLSLAAGCTTVSGQVPPPEVPDDQLSEGGWEQTDESTGVVYEHDLPGVTVTATEHTLRYTDQELQSVVDDRTLGFVDTTLNVFFATRVDFDPNIDSLPGGVGRRELMDAVEANAKQGFEDQLAAAGLQNIRETQTDTLTVETGETADLTRYLAEASVTDIEFPVTEEETLALEPAILEVQGRLALWHHEDSVLIAGGANPGENFVHSTTEDLSEGITVTVDIDLGLEPISYRQEIRDLIVNVS